ncbi:MAG: 50S ribosomal protein L15 [Candidatus Sericytochromatia bacterium]
MKLEDLKPAEGSTKKPKRKGRGWGSGNGKTAGRGNNGQGQRSGGGVRPGFEGGQKPLFRRVPKKKYFYVVNKVNYGIINVGDLAKYAEGTTVNLELLQKDGLVRADKVALRVLGNGEVKTKLTVEAFHFTASAQEKLEAAGCTLVVLGADSEEQ